MLCLQELDRNDLNLLKIITFLGLKSQVIFLNDFEYALNYLREQIMENDVCAVINCRALSKAHKSGDIGKLKEFFFSRSTSMFIYNLSPNHEVAQTISSLSEGKLRSVYHLASDDRRYTISNENIYITRHFHGLSFGPIHSECDFTFNTVYDHEDMLPLISIDDHPFFIKYRKCRCEVFFVANNQIVDIDMKIDDPKKIRDYFSQLIPHVMFLKYVFGDNCWHTPSVTANFMVDDPLLKKKYGFLNYRMLLERMDRHNIHTTISFIPINYNRTDQDIARLFLDRPERFSLCVHGSQHTYSEFGINNLQELNNKISMASRRMDEHESITGVPYDKVMVFPLGVFSCNTMKMLKYHNYHAAVNTEAVPYNNDNRLKISACLEPAIMNYAGFPLFLRRYPEYIEDFAFDSFFGKPLLIVEHHTFFKEGYQKFEDLVTGIRTLDSSIRWEGLGSIVKQSYLFKNRNDGNIDVKMYANPTLITNASNRKKTYYIRKSETDHNLIEEIRIIGGEIISSEKNTDTIYVVAEIQPRTRAELTIEYTNTYSKRIQGPQDIDSAKVMLRRYLSEIRDNYVLKSHFLSSIAFAGLKGVTRARDLMHTYQWND